MPILKCFPKIQQLDNGKFTFSIFTDIDELVYTASDVYATASEAFDVYMKTRQNMLTNEKGVSPLPDNGLTIVIPEEDEIDNTAPKNMPIETQSMIIGIVTNKEKKYGNICKLCNGYMVLEPIKWFDSDEEAENFFKTKEWRDALTRALISLGLIRRDQNVIDLNKVKKLS